MALMDRERIVAIEFRDDGYRWCPSCGTQEVARQYDASASLETVAEVLEEVNDGGALTAGYSYDAEVIRSTVTPLGGLSMGRLPLDRCHACDVPLKGGTPCPTLDGAPLRHYFFSDDDPLVVFWPPQRLGIDSRP